MSKVPTTRQRAVIQYVASNPGQNSRQIIQGLTDLGFWPNFNYTTGRLYLIIRCKKGGWIDTPDWKGYYSSHERGGITHSWTITEKGLEAMA